MGGREGVRNFEGRGILNIVALFLASGNKEGGFEFCFR